MSVKNMCFFTGRVATAPELQYLASGTAILNMGLPVNEPRKTEDGWEDETTWVDLTFFGKSAESAAKLQVGNLIQVQCRYTKAKKDTDAGPRTYHNFTVQSWSRLTWESTENSSGADEADEEPF